MRIFKRIIFTLFLFLIVVSLFYFLGIVLDALLIYYNETNSIIGFEFGWSNVLISYKKTLPIITSIIGAVLFLIINIFYSLKYKFNNPAKFVQGYSKAKTDAYGNSKLMSEDEMIKHFGRKRRNYYSYRPSKLENSKLLNKRFFRFFKRFIKEKHCTKSGWLVGSKISFKKFKYLMLTRDVNMVTIGSPGVGKTQYFLMPNILLNSISNEKPTMIINDVKGELFNNLSKKLSDNGYDIYNINLRNERSSTRFNPLELMWRYYHTYLDEFTFRKVIGNVTKDIVSFNLAKQESVIIFDQLKISFVKDDKSKIVISSKNPHIFFSKTVNGFPQFKMAITVDNETSKLYVCTTENKQNNVLFCLEILKNSSLIDKVTTEILALSSTIIPEGSGENQTWNSGSRGIIEGCIWAMLEDSTKAANQMTLEKFTINNIGNIINKMASDMPSWLKNRDKKTSRAMTAAAVIIDNESEKTVSSYISNTNSLLKEYLTSGITYITSGSDFDLKDIIEGEKPVALFITIPDENSTKYPIATLLIKQLYNFMIYLATESKDDHLKRKAYFYLDEFAQMPKIKEFKQWTGACRSRWIYFDIILQSVSQLYSIYGKEEGSSILSNCAIHLYLGSSDIETVKYFHDELGKETIVTRSSSNSSKDLNSGNINANYSLTSRDIVPMNQLTNMIAGTAYFKLFREDPCKTTFVPYFNQTANKIGLFEKGFIDASKQEIIYSERDTFYDISQKKSEEEKPTQTNKNKNAGGINKETIEMKKIREQNRQNKKVFNLKKAELAKHQATMGAKVNDLTTNFVTNYNPNTYKKTEQSSKKVNIKRENFSFPKSNKERQEKVEHTYTEDNLIITECTNNFDSLTNMF